MAGRTYMPPPSGSSVPRLSADPSAAAPGTEVKASAGCLLVHVLAARGLAGKDKERMADPFVRVKIGTQSLKTTTLERSLAPRWNETFRYEMTESCPDISLTIWDEKTKLFMGETTIPLDGHKDVPFQLSKEHWFRLKGKREGPRTTDIKQMKAQRKDAKKKAKKHDYADLISGEILVRIGQKTDSTSAGSDLTAALVRNKPVRFEDYEKVALEDIIAESEQIVDESPHSTERSLRMAAQIRELGFTTLAQRQEQGEKLRNVQEGVIQINADLRQGERELRSISSLGGAIVNSMTSRPDGKKYRHINTKKNQISDELCAEDSLRLQLDDPHRVVAGSSSDAYSPRAMLKEGAFDHLSADAQHAMSQTEDNLDAISSALDDIASMSKQMGAEIQEHNRMLEELAPAVARTTERTKKAANKTR